MTIEALEKMEATEIREEIIETIDSTEMITWNVKSTRRADIIRATEKKEAGIMKASIEIQKRVDMGTKAQGITERL